MVLKGVNILMSKAMADGLTSSNELKKLIEDET